MGSVSFSGDLYWRGNSLYVSRCNQIAEKLISFQILDSEDEGAIDSGFGISKEEADYGIYSSVDPLNKGFTKKNGMPLSFFLEVSEEVDYDTDDWKCGCAIFNYEGEVIKSLNVTSGAEEYEEYDEDEEGVPIIDKMKEDTFPKILKFQEKWENEYKDFDDTDVISEGNFLIKDGVLIKYNGDEDELTEVLIPEGVSAIASFAFYGCEFLETVTFPSCLKKIGYKAFGCCYHLPEEVQQYICGFGYEDGFGE
jgi:hypothetical protein